MSHVREAAADRRETQVPAAKTPVSSTRLAALGMLWALVLIAIGAVGIRDALVAAGVFGPPQWVDWAVEQVGGFRPDLALLAAATLVGLLGLLLLLQALRPRRRRGVAVGAQAGTFLRHRHLSRLLAARVETLDGVLRAQASARGRKVTVVVRGVDGIDASDLRARAQAALTEEVAVLAKPVRADVRVVQGGRS